MFSLERAGATLNVDIGAIATNWRTLRDSLGHGAECGAVVKTDAYGLGAVDIAPALAKAGCRTFFVAHAEEGIALRRTLHRERIFVLHGPMPGTETDFLVHDLIPVINTPGQFSDWRRLAERQDRKLACALHFNTGMTRLGLTASDFADILNAPAGLDAVDVVLLMSHLACGDEPDHPMNRAQLEQFETARAALRWKLGQDVTASLAASSGILLGPDYHFNLVRPGVAMYGMNPTPGNPVQLHNVVTLQARILQVQDVDLEQSVGYGASWRAKAPGRIATVAVGYGDGFSRAHSNRSCGYIEGQRVPLVGRVSMDLTTFDVSGLPEDVARPGALIELIGPHRPVDAIAADTGTIGYEILTSLGRRYHRRYVGEVVALDAQEAGNRRLRCVGEET